MYGIVGFIIGVVVGLFFFSLFKIPIDISKNYGVLETVYYILGPIGVLATISAVIVALFGDDFKRVLHREKCDVYLESDHFVEDISGQESSTSIKSKRYDCYLMIKNVGGREIENCSVNMVSCKHRENEQSKWKDLKIKNKRPLYWSVPNQTKESLLTGETKSLLLLRINPDGEQSTPDNNTANVSEKKLSIMGFSPDVKNRKRGFWEIEYSVCTQHDELMRFKINAAWTGEWRQREKEMLEESSVELVKIK